MNGEQLLNVIASMKLEILDLLLNDNLVNDRKAQRTINNINNMFDTLNLTVDDVIPEEVLNNYLKGTRSAKVALEEVGLGAVKSNAYNLTSLVHVEAVAEITDDLMLDLKSAIRTAQGNSNTSIKDTLSDVKRDLQSGIIKGNTRKETTKAVAKSFEENGMTSFITSDGKRLPLDFYSEAVVRTNLHRANTNGMLNKYKEEGLKHVTVGGHTPTCESCYNYRGIVFSLVDDGGSFPYLPPNTFPLHVNCRCTLQPWEIDYMEDEEIKQAIADASKFNPNADVRSEHMKKAYKDDQDLKRRLNAEKKQYARYKAVLGDDDGLPKTLGGFRRSKASNSDNFKELVRDYREANKGV